MKAKILNLSEENIGKYLCNLVVEEREVRKHFSRRTQKALTVKNNNSPPQKKTVDKLDFIKIKNSAIKKYQLNICNTTDESHRYNVE